MSGGQGQNPHNDISRALLYDRAALVRKITRDERALADVNYFLLVGLGTLGFGLFLLWLVLGNVTLYTIGSVRVVADPISYGGFGALLAFLGLACFFGSFYIRFNFPSKLEKLKQDLQGLDELITHQKVFPADFRQKVGQDFHVHYQDYLKERRRVRSMQSRQVLFRSYGLPLCMAAAGLYVVTQGFGETYQFEITLIGGLFTLFGATWVSLVYIRRHRKKARKNVDCNPYSFSYSQSAHP